MSGSRGVGGIADRREHMLTRRSEPLAPTATPPRRLGHGNVPFLFFKRDVPWPRRVWGRQALRRAWGKAPIVTPCSVAKKRTQRKYGRSRGTLVKGIYPKTMDKSLSSSVPVVTRRLSMPSASLRLRMRK